MFTRQRSLRRDHVRQPPVFLLTRQGDTLIPAAESEYVAERLRSQQVPVRLLLTDLISHAEAEPARARHRRGEACELFGRLARSMNVWQRPAGLRPFGRSHDNRARTASSTCLASAS